MKICRRCEKLQPRSSFHARKGSSDGLHSYCKACIKQQVNEWREKNYERYRTVDNARHRANSRSRREQYLRTVKVPESERHAYLTKGIRTGSLALSGPDSPGWKGDNVGYLGAHHRVLRQRGKASDRLCIDCGETAREWSYRGGCPAEKIGSAEQSRGAGSRYSPNPEMYDPRCAACHRAFDGNLSGAALAAFRWGDRAQ